MSRTDEFHPTQMLADVLISVIEHCDKPLSQKLAYVYIGDARNNMGNSLFINWCKIRCWMSVFVDLKHYYQKQVLWKCKRKICERKWSSYYCNWEDIDKAVERRRFYPY